MLQMIKLTKTYRTDGDDRIFGIGQIIDVERYVVRRKADKGDLFALDVEIGGRNEDGHVPFSKQIRRLHVPGKHRQMPTFGCED